MRSEKFKFVYLSKAFLTVIFQVFGVNIDVVPVDPVWVREPDGVVHKFLHLYGWWVFVQFLKGFQQNIGGCDTVWRSQEERLLQQLTEQKHGHLSKEHKRTGMFQWDIVQRNVQTARNGLQFADLLSPDQRQYNINIINVILADRPTSSLNIDMFIVYFII